MSVVRLKSYIAARVRRCRAVMAERKLDVLIVVDPVDVRYLTGFGGGDSVLVLSGHRKVLVTDSRFTLQARQECPGLALKIRGGAMPGAVGEVLQRLRGRKKRFVVGIESDSITLNQYQLYRRSVPKQVRSIQPLVSVLRQNKDDYEVAQIRKAIRVAQESMTTLLAEALIGKTERELAARLEYEMASRGSTSPAFETIVAVGGHAAQPHAVPGKLKWRRNQPILFDWGATVNGYRSDLTRCFSPGKIRPVFADAYQRLLEAQLTAIEEVREGVSFEQVDSAARKLLKRCKWPIYGHGTGHGLGLQTHEWPYLKPAGPGAKRSKRSVLQVGMVLTIEPGIYVPGRFGIRIEDDVLVTERGAKVLTSLAKDLDSVQLEQV